MSIKLLEALCLLFIIDFKTLALQFQRSIFGSCPRATAKLVDIVCDQIRLIRKPSDLNGSAAGVKEEYLRAKVGDFISRNEPISFVLPAFPCKSTNTITKVVGDLPDLGENIALSTLTGLIERIARLYPPGGIVRAVYDGEVFSDLLGIRDSTIVSYQRELEKMATGMPIIFASLPKLLGFGVDVNKLRCYLDSLAPPTEELKQTLLAHSEGKALYVSLVRFSYEDLLVHAMSDSQRTKAAKLQAIAILRRNHALRKVVAEHFKDEIRLSVHRHPDTEDMIGINLVPGQEGTPWHHVAAVGKNGSVSMIKRSEAEKRGYDMFYRFGRPFGYVEVGEVF